MVPPAHTAQYHKDLNNLRSILLEDDRKEVDQIKRVLNDKEAFYAYLEPHLDRKLSEFRKDFPIEYQRLVWQMIDEKIEGSQEKIVETIYPVMGQVIRKYVEHQFQAFRESIEERIREAGRKLSFWERFTRKNTDISDAHRLIGELNRLRIVEIYLVERHSGLVIAHAAEEQNLDADAIAGMLTAIKSFVEDAFKRDNEQLDYIQYANYKIVVENYRSYYIAAMVEGNVTMLDRMKLLEQLNQFIVKEYVQFAYSNDSNLREKLSSSLHKEFIEKKHNINP